MKKLLQTGVNPLLLLLLVSVGQYAWGQCTNTSAFGTITAPTTNTTTTITTCAYAGEYSTVTGCTAGSTYQFNATGGTLGNYITIRQGTFNGTVLGFGTPPLSVTCTASGPLYLHYNTNAACGTESACRTGTVSCTSCGGGANPCSSITTLTCGTAVSATLSGAGAWNTSYCGFGLPGNEKVYSFTPTVTGTYTLQVNSTSATGYIDYAYKAASLGCSSTGWTCIIDVFSPNSVTFGPLTAGTTYYLLLDAETTTSITHNFQINCLSVFDPCASVPTLSCGTAVTASTSGAGVWSPGSCGFSTPGKEQVYSFTPTVTGIHTLVITGTNSLYADYFFKAASGGCNSTGWTCIGDASLPESNSFGPLTAGTTYYILYDPESSGSAVTQTFRVDCPVAFDPCASIPTLTCGTAVTASTTGAGVWSPGNCGFSTPGKEQVYSFTPTVSGTHTLVITGTNSLYADYFYKTASGGCSSTGWTCIGDASLPESNNFGPLTAGTTYYILYDPESSASAVTQTFRVDCPPAGSAPGCVSAPTSPTSGSNAGCPNTTQTLTWPAAANATSYDVYFGTSTTPPFVTNTTGTSYTTGALASGTYYWQILPKNSFGTATGCAVWNFIKIDNTPPTITCPANIATTNNPATACSAVVTYAVSGSDNCSTPSLVQIGGLPSGSPFLVGITINTWRATDAAGLSSTCSFTVTVTDATLPSITCPANIAVNNSPAAACSAVVTYATPTASDNCGVGTVLLTSGLGSGATFPVGVTTNVWRATDVNANTKTCSFTVTVTDVTLPTITCPSSIVANNAVGLCGANVNYTNPTATDNCGVASVTQISGLASGAFYPVGTTTNVWRAQDVNGNASTCSFTVKVNDVEAPTVNCPDDLVKQTDFGFCSKTLGNFLGNTTFSDNCGVVSLTSNNPGTFPIGTTIVTYTAKDGSNNAGTCTMSVTVEDGEWPVVHCPSNINVKTDLGDCVATINYTATATDNCAGVSIAYSTDPLSAFQIGLTNVEVTATDAAGHTSSCVFQVNVGTRAEECNDLDDDCDGWVDEAENWPALAKRLAGNGGPEEEYGQSVAIDGDYAIVGSNRKNPSGQNQGAAYILFRNQNGDNKWGQVAELIVPGLAAGDNFGASVAISGNLAAVGAPQTDGAVGNEGAVYVFSKNGDIWSFVKKVTANDSGSGDNYGAHIALEAETLLVGATGNDEAGSNAGAAYVHYRNTGGADNWGQVAKLLANSLNPDDNFGASVALDGDYALVGATGVDGLVQNIGAAFLFGRNNFGANAWGQVAKIKANQSGQNDNFGVSVDISGPWAIVGADRNDLKGADAGAAYIFYKNNNGVNNSWGQHQLVLDYNGQAGDHFGAAVGMDEPYAVVAAKGDNPFGQNSGRGFAYYYDGNAWIPVDQLADSGGQTGDALGTSAAISGQTIILGAPLDNNGANSNQGSVVVYGGLCNDAFSPEVEERAFPTNESAAAVRCFPVPFSDVLNIEVNNVHAQEVQLTVVNTMGQTVTELFRGALDGDGRFVWQPGNAPDGLYFLRLTTGAKVITTTIVRNR